MHLPLLNDLLVILALAIGVTFVANRLKIPAIVALLVAGILAGPHGLALVQAAEDVEKMAEIGVILLLFNIGVEFSIEKLIQIRRIALAGGALQMGLSGAAGAGAAYLAGLGPRQSLVAGGLVALSSTAVVLKQLQSRAELDTPHGRTGVGILLFQDLAAIPMMLALPFLAGQAEFGSSFSFDSIKTFLIVIGVLAAAKWLVPILLHHAARSRDREVFALTVVFLLFGIAWMTGQAGLSLALGAFVAGLLLSDSEYGHEAVSILLPFGHVFLAFFFIAMGMLVDPSVYLHSSALVIELTLAVIVVKTLAAAGASLIVGYPLRIALLAGLSLAQVGEFSFILAKGAKELGLLGAAENQLFLAVSILTMLITPFLIAAAPAIADRLSGWKEATPHPSRAAEASKVKFKGEEIGHLIIVGYGLNGRVVARAAEATGIPYVVVETNPTTVRTEGKKGVPILYGDATQRPILEYAGIDGARTIVIAVSDPAATRRMTQLARRMNPSIHILVRTHYVRDSAELHELGADEVIAAEYESSIEVFTRVMKQFLVPDTRIREVLSEFRAEGYRLLRGKEPPEHPLPSQLAQLRVPEMDVASFELTDTQSEILGEPLSSLQLRRRYAVNVLAYRRGNHWESELDGRTMFRKGDLILVLGTTETLTEFGRWLENTASVRSSEAASPPS